MTGIIGWDIGGANVKAASAEANGITRVAQVPCPIMPDRRKFDEAVGTAGALFPKAELHAVTMTGELSDVFQNREEGVSYLIALTQRLADAATLLIYAGEAGLLPPDEARARPLEVASANWQATAALLAHHFAEALLVDVGTTTTDLIPIKIGRVAARELTDGERLTEGELVYSGVVRTPVMAIAQTAPFRGRIQRIAAERFATMADVFRLTGDLPEGADPYPPADQRGKSASESAARLARMLGRDAEDAEHGDWVTLARYFAGAQIASIEKATRSLCERDELSASAPVVGAGCGRFIAKAIAARLSRPYVDFGEHLAIAPEAREMAARCAPAVAVALLAHDATPR
jgi:probable H4MPT-linked C1 transfer pathway protein